MRRIYLHLPIAESASRYYRLLLPYRHCVDRLRVEHQVELVLSPTFRAADLHHFDGAVLLREPEPDLLNIFLAARANRSGTERPFRLAWNIDDDFWNVPEWSQAWKAYQNELLMARCSQMRQYADFVWSSTPILSEALKRNASARVLPNYLDLRDWPEPQPRDYTAPTRVVWAGSHTHAHDVLRLVEGVKWLQRQQPGKYEFHFIGDVPGDLIGRFERHGLIHHEMVPLAKYPQFLVSLRPDIGLLPLEDNPFNRSKSNIKWLEYTAAGARTVTDAPWCYPEASRLTLAEQWAEAIQLAAQDTSAEFNRRAVLADHCWQNDTCVDVWMNAFLELAGVV